MTNGIDRRDFLKTGLTVLAGTALGFYPTQAGAQGNLVVQLHDIERYVSEHPTGRGGRGVILKGRHFFQNVPSNEYDGRNFGIAAHNYGMLIDDSSGNTRRLFYDSKENGLGTVDALIDLPKNGLRLSDEQVRAFLFGSDGALTSLAENVDERRDNLRMGQKSVWDMAIVKRRNQNGRINIYDFPNKSVRLLPSGESRTAINEMQDSYRKIVELIHKQITS